MIMAVAALATPAAVYNTVLMLAGFLPIAHFDSVFFNAACYGNSTHNHRIGMHAETSNRVHCARQSIKSLRLILIFFAHSNIHLDLHSHGNDFKHFSEFIFEHLKAQSHTFSQPKRVCSFNSLDNRCYFMILCVAQSGTMHNRLEWKKRNLKRKGCIVATVTVLLVSMSNQNHLTKSIQQPSLKVCTESRKSFGDSLQFQFQKSTFPMSWIKKNEEECKMKIISAIYL